MKEPAFIEKLNRGPVGLSTVTPRGPFPMGRTMALGVVGLLAIGFPVALVAGHMISADAPYVHIFLATGLVAFLAHGGGHIPDAISWGKPWSNAWKDVIDGAISALLTAGSFAGFWPRRRPPRGRRS
jgi:hypothetical protein